MQLVVAVALFALATRASAGLAAACLVGSIAATVATLGLWAASTGAPTGVISGFVINQGIAFAAPAIAATALGLLWAIHARRTVEARDRARQVAREHEERVAAERELERARIAQELHDVAAQHIAGLVSLCDASAVLAPEHPEQALQLIDEVRAEGRFAAASLYSALGDLRAVDATTTTVTPDLHDVEELISFWSQRGMAVDLNTVGNVAELPAIVSTTAYRGLQEGLANAAKHAPGSTVEVALVVHTDRMQATITNTAGNSTRRPEERLGLGWGLDGLRAKLRLIDGTLHAGTNGDDGWRTRMDIPFPNIDGDSHD